MTTTRSATFTTTHRVRNGVHRRAASRRPNTLPAVAASLPDLLHVVFDIADTTDCRLASRWHATHLSRWKRDLRPVLLASIQNRSGTSRPTHFGSTAGNHLNVVNHHT